jgi:hypothetical protein
VRDGSLWTRAATAGEVGPTAVGIDRAGPPCTARCGNFYRTATEEVKSFSMARLARDCTVREHGRVVATRTLRYTRTN